LGEENLLDDTTTKNKLQPKDDLLWPEDDPIYKERIQ
jgi:hypothetical protein